MVAQFFAKFAAEVLDYKVDWTLPLNGDTILSTVVTTADFTQTTPATIDVTNKIVTFWVGAGAVGNTGRVLVTIVTAGGRTMQAEVFITVQPL